MEDGAEIFVASGEMIAYRLFDIAYAVNLDRAEIVLAQRRGAGGVRKQLNATPPKAVAYDVPPLVLTLDPVPLTIRGPIPPRSNVLRSIPRRGRRRDCLGQRARDRSRHERELQRREAAAQGPKSPNVTKLASRTVV